MSKKTRNEVAMLPEEKPFVLIWAEEASIDSISSASRVFSGGIEGTSEELRKREGRSKRS